MCSRATHAGRQLRKPRRRCSVRNYKTISPCRRNSSKTLRRHNKASDKVLDKFFIIEPPQGLIWLNSTYWDFTVSSRGRRVIFSAQRIAEAFFDQHQASQEPFGQDGRLSLFSVIQQFKTERRLESSKVTLSTGVGNFLNAPIVRLPARRKVWIFRTHS